MSHILLYVHKIFIVTETSIIMLSNSCRPVLSISPSLLTIPLETGEKI